MKLTTNDRAALAEAIRGNVDGERSFWRGPAGSFSEYAEAMGRFAARIERGEETEDDRAALPYLASLPYTQPPVDDENTQEEDDRAARFFLALFKVNNLSHRFIDVRPDDAREVIYRRVK